jgi:tetrahydromethanopterin S-methyltransferase subunit B
MAIVKVDGQPGLIKDTKTGVVLNTNREEIIAARERKARIKAEKEKTERLAEDVENLKNDIGEIKDLLLRMIDVNNNNRSE